MVAPHNNALNNMPAIATPLRRAPETLVDIPNNTYTKKK